MALNIGSINFGVDANTAGLQKAITQLQQFQRVVDQTAKAQTQGAQQAANALGRQESAIKRAFQQTLNLQRAMRQAGADVGEIGRVTQAFQRLTREMSSGNLTAVQFSRSLDAFNARLNRSSRTLKDLQAQNAAKSISGLSALFKDLQASAVLTFGPLSGFGARLNSLGALANRTTVSMAATVAGIVAVGVGFYKLAANATATMQIIEKMEARLRSLGGTQESVGKQFDYIVRVSKTLGLQIEDVSDAYTKMQVAAQGTALEGEGVRNIFIAISEAGAAMRLSSQDMQGIFLAIIQMMSKGTIQAEELRNQLGDRLPGAFKLFAKSMGISEQALNSLLKKGGVSVDNLNNFAITLHKTFGPEARANIEAYQGSINNLHNSYFLLGKAFDRVVPVFELEKKGINALASAINLLVASFNKIGDAFDYVSEKSKGFAQRVENIAGQLAKANPFLAPFAYGVSAIMRALASEDAAAKVKQTADALADFNKIAASPNITAKYGQVADKIHELEQNAAILSRTMELLQKQDTFTADKFDIDGLIKAVDLINNLNPDELEQLAKDMGIAGAGTDQLVVAVGKLFSTIARDQSVIDDWQSKMERTPEILRDVNTAINKVIADSDALDKGPRAVELQRRQDEKIRAMEQLHDKLRQTTLSQDEQNDKLAQYSKYLDEVVYKTDHLNTTSADWASAIVDGIDEALFHGEKFSDMLKNLGNELIDLAFRAVVLKPFENALSGAFGNIFGSFGRGTGLAPNVSVEPQGPPEPHAMGGILMGPTLFGGGRRTHIAGEAGPEAILPLSRTQGGALGVRATGGGSGGTVVNVIDQRSGGASPEVSRSRTSDGRDQIDIIIRDKVRAAFDSGQLDRTMNKNYGLGRKGTR